MVLGLDGSHESALLLPNDAGLLGGRCHAQGAALAPASNALGVVTSNGQALVFGGV